MKSWLLDCRVAALLAMTEEVVTASEARQSMKSWPLDCRVAALLAMTKWGAVCDHEAGILAVTA